MIHVFRVNFRATPARSTAVRPPMRKVRESSMSSLRSVVYGSLALTILVSVAAMGAPRADVVVSLDEAKLLRLPDKTATIVVGNPLIADASPQAGGQIVITGKGYGMTNIIALDRAGKVLMQKNIVVEGPAGHVVVIYKGMERETYSCTPSCERRITLGDGKTYFDTIIMQSNTRSGQAEGNSSAPK
jgi:hypothetical protein